MQGVLERRVVQRGARRRRCAAGSGAKPSSARAPSCTIDHGTSRSCQDASRTPATKRSQSAIIASKASSVRTSLEGRARGRQRQRVARERAADAADVDEVGVVERLDARAEPRR